MGHFGAPAGQYAPVYLWPREEQMWGFLAGPAFAAIKDLSVTPPVATWSGLVFARAQALDQFQTIRCVTRQLETLSPAADLIDLVRREQDHAQTAIATEEGLLARTVGLDPRSWNLVRFDFWARPQTEPEPGIASYEVLHVAAPQLDALSATVASPVAIIGDRCCGCANRNYRNRARLLERDLLVMPAGADQMAAPPRYAARIGRFAAWGVIARFALIIEGAQSIGLPRQGSAAHPLSACRSHWCRVRCLEVAGREA